MDLKILEDVGWGYSKLAVVTDAALRRLGVKYNIEIIGNPLKFHSYNIEKSPALLIDDKVVLEGYEPSLEEMIELLINFHRD